jgi:hypothetical protein
MPLDGFVSTEKDAFAGYSAPTSDRFFRPRHGLPIPHRTQFRIMIGEPIDAAGRGGADDEHAVRSLRREVEGALHELFEEELARRARFPYAC